MAANTESTALATQAQSSTGLLAQGSFELIQRVAVCLSKSDLVPAQYRGEKGMPNAVIAIELANRMGLSPLMVMQNLNIIQGKPSWSSTFVIAAINSIGRFSPLKFRMVGERGKESWGCVATARYIATGEDIEGPEVTMAMAKAEGWTSRNGSKWKTMPEVMLRYRAATFFGRLYAPEALMGIRPMDEFEDIAAAEAARELMRRGGQQPQPTAAPSGNGRAPAPTSDAMISIDQWEQIKAALRDRQMPQTKLLELLGVSRPGAIPLARFDEALGLANSTPPATTAAHATAAPATGGTGRITEEQLQRINAHLERTGLANDEEFMRRVLEPYGAESFADLLGLQAEIILVELRDMLDAGEGADDRN